jgi:hypothetical protein
MPQNAGVGLLRAPQPDPIFLFLLDGREPGPKALEIAPRTNAIFVATLICYVDENERLSTNVVTPACVDRSNLESCNGPQVICGH